MKTWSKLTMKDYVTGLLVSVLAVFAPIKATLITMLILVFVDLVTGMLAARKRQEKLSSAGIRRTVSKLAVYLTAILVGFLTETYMLEGFIPVSKIAAGLIGVVEIKSVLENLDTVNGSPLFKALISKLGSDNDLPKAPPEEKAGEE